MHQTTNSEGEPDPRPHGGSIAGAAAAAVALSTGEVLAALTGFFPSFVNSVSSLVIDLAPRPLVDFGIGAFGTLDKVVLVVVALALTFAAGAAIGRAANQNLVRATLGATAFGAIGVVAALLQSDSPAIGTLLGAIVAVAAGIAVYAGLMRRAAPRLSASVVHTASNADPEEGETPPASPEPQGLSRRRFFWTAAGIGAGSGLAAVSARLVSSRIASEAARSQVTLPVPANSLPPPAAGASFNVGRLTPLVTPNDDFYKIDTAVFTPRVDPTRWDLSVTGMVRNPFSISFRELLAMEMVEEYVTLACVSNEVGGDLIGNARWLGVPLVKLLDRAGVEDRATQIVGRSSDGFTVGFPTVVALDGRVALVAVGMNGEPLPGGHGFPARLVVAGLYGYVSATKWITEIELTTLEAFDAYWIPRGWAKQAPIKTQSRIDVPRASAHLAPGKTPIAGVAWAPSRGISKVEVQIDDQPWLAAELADSLSVNSWRQWIHSWDAAPGRHVLKVRATDDRGETQTERISPPDPDGATGYHTISVSVGDS